MDLSFAAAGSEVDGDWGDDDLVEAPGETKSLARCSRSRSRSPETAPKELPPQLSLTNGPASSSASTGAAEGSNGLVPPKSKIHGNTRTRYFVIKSNSHKNLVLSVENDVWATQRHNEEKLNEALRNAPHVILIFSVNMSGGFQGYAKMIGNVGASRKKDVFQGYGRAFDIRWLRLQDLDFQDVGSISNPWNEDKSVKISRDGQELPNQVGAQLCEMVDLRVFRGDPAGYVTDEREVETGGFNPPPSPGCELQAQAPTSSTYGADARMSGPVANGRPRSSIAAALPHHAMHAGLVAPAVGPPPNGVVPAPGMAPGPPMHPWGGPWAGYQSASTWAYPPWGSGLYCSESSYYSDSYYSSSSSSGEGERKRAKKALPQARPPSQGNHFLGVPALTPVPPETPGASSTAAAAPAPIASRSSKESSKKSKKDKAAKPLPQTKDGKDVKASKKEDRSKSHRKHHREQVPPVEKAKTPEQSAKHEKKSKDRREKTSKEATQPEKKRRRPSEADVAHSSAAGAPQPGEVRKSERDRRRRKEESHAGNPAHSSRDRTRRRGRDSNGKGAEASMPDSWRGATPLAQHPAPAVAQSHGRDPLPQGWPGGYGHGHPPAHHVGVQHAHHLPPPAPFRGGTTARVPPLEWHGACPLRK